MNPSTCPLCGGSNACAIQQGKRIEDCWCYTANIPRETLERIPLEARGRSCICPSCAGVQMNSEDQHESRA